VKPGETLEHACRSSMSTRPIVRCFPETEGHPGGPITPFPTRSSPSTGKRGPVAAADKPAATKATDQRQQNWGLRGPTAHAQNRKQRLSPRRTPQPVGARSIGPADRRGSSGRSGGRLAPCNTFKAGNFPDLRRQKIAQTPGLFSSSALLIVLYTMFPRGGRTPNQGGGMEGPSHPRPCRCICATA